jgi:hypothetical protein
MEDDKKPINFIMKDQDGNVLVEEHNTCTNFFPVFLIKRMGGWGPYTLEFDYGDGSGATAATSTALSGSTIFTAYNLTHPLLTSATDSYTLQYLLSETQANGTSISEVGLFWNSLMLARATFSAITKNDLTTIDTQWTITLV